MPRKLFGICAFSRGCLAPVLILALAIPRAAVAQVPATPPQEPRPAPAITRTLQVLALAGDGETNDMEGKVMAPLVVQVLDLSARPADGASVTFRFPLGGPSAQFPNQSQVQTVRTNSDGQAAATGWTANGVPGPFRVRVVAQRGNETGDTVITMINGSAAARAKRDEPKKWWNSGWFKFALIAGAAGGVTAGILLTRGNTPAITVTPGTPTIGGVAP